MQWNESRGPAALSLTPTLSGAALPRLIKPKRKKRRKKTGDSLALHSALNNLAHSQSSFVWGGEELKQTFAHRDKKWRAGGGEKEKKKNIRRHKLGAASVRGRAVLVAGRAECAFSYSTSPFAVAAAEGRAEAIKNGFPSDILLLLLLLSTDTAAGGRGKTRQKVAGSRDALFVGHSRAPSLPVCSILRRSASPSPHRAPPTLLTPRAGDEAVPRLSAFGLPSFLPFRTDVVAVFF